MIFAIVYLVISIVIYVELFKFIQQESKRSKTFGGHPEMQQVKPDDSLLVINFDGSPGTPSAEQHPDLGFAEFLSNRDTDSGNSGDSRER
jgi:hypothetical protein